MATLMGVLFIVLGLIAIGEPLVAGLAVAVLAGWLLLAGGIVHAVSAFRAGGAKSVIWHALLAVLYLAGGVYFVTHPLLGLGTLTLFLSAILFIEGVVWVIAYFQLRSGNIWMLLNGVITLVLGLMIWARLAIDFGLGDWDAPRREPGDDRHVDSVCRRGAEKAGGLTRKRVTALAAQREGIR